MPEAQPTNPPQPTEADRATAERLADELRERRGQVWTRRKVTTLLSEFGA